MPVKVHLTPSVADEIWEILKELPCSVSSKILCALGFSWEYELTNGIGSAVCGEALSELSTGCAVEGDFNLARTLHWSCAGSDEKTRESQDIRELHVVDIQGMKVF